MKKAAWLALPIGLIVVVLFALRSGGPVMDRSLGFGIFVLIFFPTVILESLVFLCRRVRTMRCHQCSWEKDYPFDAKPPP